MPRVIYENMPGRIFGYCREDAEGYQTVVLNARLTREANQQTFIHEISHEHDFNAAADVDALEATRHKKSRLEIETV